MYLNFKTSTLKHAFCASEIKKGLELIGFSEDVLIFGVFNDFWAPRNTATTHSGNFHMLKILCFLMDIRGKFGDVEKQIQGIPTCVWKIFRYIIEEMIYSLELSSVQIGIPRNPINYSS